MVGSFLVHKVLGPRTPPPPPLSSDTSLGCSPPKKISLGHPLPGGKPSGEDWMSLRCPVIAEWRG